MDKFKKIRMDIKKIEKKLIRQSSNKKDYSAPRSHFNLHDLNMTSLPKGIGAGNVGSIVWNNKWNRYQKMKEFGRQNEMKNKSMLKKHQGTKSKMDYTREKTNILASYRFATDEDYQQPRIS
jgi:hypothetical protein